MKKTLIAIASISALVAISAILVSISKSANTSSSATLDQLQENLKTATSSASQEIQPLESSLRDIGRELRNISNVRTPRPRQNAENNQIIQRIRAADEQRERRIRNAEQTVSSLLLSFNDLQQRLTQLESRLSDAVKDTKEKIMSNELASKGFRISDLVAILGMMTSLSATLLAWRKDSREVIELRLKLAEFTQTQNIKEA